MKTSLISNNYSLFNVANYKKNIDENTSIVLDKYFKVLIEYLKYILDTIKIKNTSYSKFILLRGIETIDHVFNMLLYYTNNLDITYFHTQKSVYFYVEFIQQTSTEENSFLQLSSRDATMYVYRKTIFEISNDHRKNINNHINKETKNKWEIISKNTNILKKIINNIITKDQFQEYPLKYISKYETIGFLLIKKSYNLEDQNNIDYIINKIKIEFSIEEYLEFIELILSKKTDGLLAIKNKLLSGNSCVTTNLDYDFFNLLK